LAIGFLALVACQVPDYQSETHHTILDSFIAKGDMKQTFKVWHYIFNKNAEYSLNSETGINKYRKFKQNLNLIQKHNAKNLSWKEGLNQFSDMDEQETEAFLGIRDKTEAEMKQIMSQMTGKFDFDSYNDDEPEPQAPKADREPVDWTAVLSPVRNQGGCGSCYAFSVEAAIEGNYIKQRRGEGKLIDETVTLSTQQIVDCSTKTGACSGGWMWNAMDYLKGGIALDKNYPYKGVKGPTCNFTKEIASDVVLTGYEYAYSRASPTTPDSVYNLLKKGPLTNCVDTAGLLRYRSGISALKCTQRCPHAINTIAWGKDDLTGLNYLKLRNSWGTTWGEKGYARVVQDYANGFSCMLEYPNYTLRPIVN